MKKLLSTVLALCMILGCVAVGFTAQAAPIGDQLQAAINNAINGSGECNWTQGDVELKQPITINGNVTINFNGATIKGAPQKNTVVISGGNVELINADIEGTSGKGIIDEVSNACPTILINNANVTLTDMVVTGAYFDLFGGEFSLPISDAITMGSANAVLNLNNVRAFGNNGVENLNGSKVNAVDCLIGGYINDFYSDANVTFAAGTTQYSGYQLFEEVLADQITLTAGEEELISKVLGRWLEVTASVKNQNYVEPTYSYDADTDTLTVTATADKSFETQVENAFDYYYVPKTAKILDQTKEFVKTGDLTYTATFENIGPDTVCDTDLVYKLAVDVYEDAQAMIDGLIAQLEDFISGIPAIINELDEQITDAVDTYINGEQGYVTILWNFYNEMGVDSLLSDLDGQIADLDERIASLPEGSQERTDALAARADAVAQRDQAKADIKAFLGPLFDLCGASLKGDPRLDSALAAVANGNPTPKQENDARMQVNSINNNYGAHLDYKTGAKGLLNDFQSYWNTAYALAVQGNAFNDIKGLGEYIGANYLNVYDSLKDAGALIRAVADLLNDSDNYVIQMLADKNVNIEGKPITSYLGVVNDAVATVDRGFAYVDRLLNSSFYTSMVDRYGSDVPRLCGIYAEKAYNIATNPNTYFDFETDGTLVEGFEFPQEATYTTPAEVAEVNVKVQISGYGLYSVKGVDYSTTQTFTVPMGGSFSVAPAEMGGETLFTYFAISDPNGNQRMSPTGGNLTVYSDVIITLFFSAPTGDGDDPIYDAVFMTNSDFSSKWIDTLIVGEVDELPDVSEFESDTMTFLGWSESNISGLIAEANPDLLLSEDDALDLVNTAESNTTLYAIFKADIITVPASVLNAGVLTMYESTVAGHKAYFTVIFSDSVLAAGETIVEAGILAAGSEETINAATPNGGSGIIKGTLDLAKCSLPAYYLYSVHFNNHSTDRTAYAKGYAIIKTANGYRTEYTNVVSQVIAAY